ncbi:hypothetical protein AAMO2058_000328500 [Amorphochlora amoebiformis]
MTRTNGHDMRIYILRAETQDKLSTRDNLSTSVSMKGYYLATLLLGVLAGAIGTRMALTRGGLKGGMRMSVAPRVFGRAGVRPVASIRRDECAKRAAWKVKAGISEVVGDVKLDGYSVKEIEESKRPDTVQMLANWYLEVLMDEDFATGRTKERQLLQSFKVSVSEGPEKIFAMTSDSNPEEPVALLTVHGWQVKGIVLSPLVQAARPTQNLLQALQNNANEKGESIQLPGDAELTPFGLTPV